MTRLLVCTLILLLICIALLTGDHVLGTLTQPTPLVTDYACAPQPCWHGIFPGTSTATEAELIIRSDASLIIDERHSDRNFGRICWQNRFAAAQGGCLYGSTNGGYIAMSFPQSPYHSGPLTFAEAINLYGTPTGIKVCYDAFNDYLLSVVLYFPGSILVSGRSFYLTPSTGRVDPNTTIEVINYHIDPASSLSPWKGFAPVTGISSC